MRLHSLLPRLELRMALVQLVPVLFDASNQLNHHVSSVIEPVSPSSIDLDHSRSSPVSIFTQCDTSAVNNPREINILHDVSANYRSFNIHDDYKDQSFEETYNLLNEGILPQVPLHLDPKMKKMSSRRSTTKNIFQLQRCFTALFARSVFSKHLRIPNKITVPEIGRTYQCTQCHSEFEKNKLRLFTLENDMDPFPRFDHFALPELTVFEIDLLFTAVSHILHESDLGPLRWQEIKSRFSLRSYFDFTGIVLETSLA